MFIPAILASWGINAQEENEACLEPSKKIVKLITAAVNAKDLRTASEKFNEAIKADEENATAYFEYAMYAYNQGLEYYDNDPNPAKGDRAFSKAEELFEQTIERCSEYHANCYYYLGVINYTQKEMENAVRWFEAFKKFKSRDVERYPEDHAKKLSDVSEVLEDYYRDKKVKETEVPFKPVIVQNVSTREMDEYFPMISPDNELMFFTRRGEHDTLGTGRTGVVEKFTISERPNMVSEFNVGEQLPAPFNIEGKFQSYGAATLSVDNKEMIFCACRKEIVLDQPYMNCDLWSSTYVLTGNKHNKYKWTEPVNLGAEINTSNGWEGQPSLSADGNTLYYTVNRPTSENNDIYIAKRKEDGTWGVGIPFDVVNTRGKDKSPFLHQDSETLYFVSESSKDRPGVGGLDIFYIRQKEDGSWTEPKNIGYPINSPNDELGIFVSIDGEIAYFSSRVGGNWNIYSFELYEEARPQKVAILKGELKDDSGTPVTDATIEVMYEGSDEVTEVKVNGDDGKYAAIVKTKDKQDVMVTVKKEGHAFDSKLINKESFKETGDVAIRDNDLKVKELKVGEAYTINDILYATNSSVLSSKSKFILKGFARFLQENPSIKVSIQGHTDDVGDDRENMILSEERAQGVKSYLLSLGIEKNRLTAKGFGETKPKVENSSEANRAKNRRTDFVIEGM